MGRTSARKTDEGRFAYEGLERVIHEKARLGVLTSLAWISTAPDSPNEYTAKGFIGLRIFLGRLGKMVR